MGEEVVVRGGRRVFGDRAWGDVGRKELRWLFCLSGKEGEEGAGEEVGEEE